MLLLWAIPGLTLYGAVAALALFAVLPLLRRGTNATQ